MNQRLVDLQRMRKELEERINEMKMEALAK